jgi:hypothetical protein
MVSASLMRPYSLAHLMFFFVYNVTWPDDNLIAEFDMALGSFMRTTLSIY